MLSYLVIFIHHRLFIDVFTDINHLPFFYLNKAILIVSLNIRPLSVYSVISISPFFFSLQKSSCSHQAGTSHRSNFISSFLCLRVDLGQGLLGQLHLPGCGPCGQYQWEHHSESCLGWGAGETFLLTGPIECCRRLGSYINLFIYWWF